MKWQIKLLRWISPQCEKQRMEFRKGLSLVEAQAEDLLRTVKIDRREIEAMQRAAKVR